jgi:hypothetical protein
MLLRQTMTAATKLHVGFLCGTTQIIVRQTHPDPVKEGSRWQLDKGCQSSPAPTVFRYLVLGAGAVWGENFLRFFQKKHQHFGIQNRC